MSLGCCFLRGLAAWKNPCHLVSSAPALKSGFLSFCSSGLSVVLLWQRPNVAWDGADSLQTILTRMSIEGISRNERGQMMKHFQIMLSKPERGCII